MNSSFDAELALPFRSVLLHNFHSLSIGKLLNTDFTLKMHKYSIDSSFVTPYIHTGLFPCNNQYHHHSLISFSRCLFEFHVLTSFAALFLCFNVATFCHHVEYGVEIIVHLSEVYIYYR